MIRKYFKTQAKPLDIRSRLIFFFIKLVKKLMYTLQSASPLHAHQSEKLTFITGLNKIQFILKKKKNYGWLGDSNDDNDLP